MPAEAVVSLDKRQRVLARSGSLPQAPRLRASGFRPKKRFGQNFLVDVNAARTIADAATMPAGATVLEIGAGLDGAAERFGSIGRCRPDRC